MQQDIVTIVANYATSAEEYMHPYVSDGLRRVASVLMAPCRRDEDSEFLVYDGGGR